MLEAYFRSRGLRSARLEVGDLCGGFHVVDMAKALVLKEHNTLRI
jgi:hypothetical protein